MPEMRQYREKPDRQITDFTAMGTLRRSTGWHLSSNFPGDLLPWHAVGEDFPSRDLDVRVSEHREAASFLQEFVH